MKRTLWFMLIGAALVAASPWVAGDADEGRGGWVARWWREARLDVAPADDPLYRAECGSCHFAYQPGLLPARAWQGIMQRLDDHFGENAELDAATAAALTRYLTLQAADRSDYKRARHFAAASGGEPLLRITATPYFQRKHDEIPDWVLTQGERSLRFSQCDRCHSAADKGIYDEDGVRIPGLGRWED